MALRAALDKERRSSERYVVVLQLAIMSSRDEQQLCLVLNMGLGGMKLRLFAPPPRCRDIIITLRGERTIAAEVTWTDNDLLGAAFKRPLTSLELIEALSGNGARVRGPRLSISMPVAVRSGAMILRTRLLNISPSGAAIETGAATLPEHAAILTIPGLPPIQAQVRWRTEQHAGLSFNAPLQLRQLQSILSKQAVDVMSP